nr:DUF1460 domain-containing protein [Bdellovibrio sp. CKG001]
MKAHLFVRIFLSGLFFVSGFAHADQVVADQQLTILMAASEKTVSVSTAQRVSDFANLFAQQKVPYLVDPLGEGSTGTVSQGPLYRFDGFDCTTFVETVLALALSSSEEQFRQRMNQIRYKDAIVSYQTRNHFPSVDWIPNNIKNGFVKDITGRVAGAKTKWSQTWIEKGEWFKRKGSAFERMGEGFEPILAQLPYVAKEDLTSSSELLARIPSGTIFHVMRPNWDLRKAIGTRLDISHMGFLVRENGVLYMVHASNGASRDGSDDSMRVKKEVLSDYVERVMMASPTMAGMNLLVPM